MDSNVPPESTLRFVDALIRARKDFDLLEVPGADHGIRGPASAYADRRMRDFFVHSLLDKEPSDHNGADTDFWLGAMRRVHLGACLLDSMQHHFRAANIRGVDVVTPVLVAIVGHRFFHQRA
jgi:hypothetical protein